MRIGFGFDSHRLVEGRKLIIGGVEISSPKGLDGHSDADVLCHAIIDALIGALGLGDIGLHFPDSDPTWKDASSIDLLSKTVSLCREKGFVIAWIDSSVIAEEPKLSPFFEEMKGEIAKAGIPRSSINIKAKTNERMGPVGQGEGVEAYAVCLLRRFALEPSDS